MFYKKAFNSPAAKAAALLVLSGTKPDLVLLDLMLPEGTI